MNPMLIAEADTGLDNQAFELVRRAAELSGQLRVPVQEELGKLVRSMNCYYSNFIEGHQTHPRQIERALKQEFANDPTQRDLQQEAFAHIQVQRLIDTRQDDQSWPISSAYVRWLHATFCNSLPTSMLRVRNPDTGREVEVKPGEYREDFVSIGRHVPPEPQQIARFMQRFDEAYNPKQLSKPQQLLSAAAAHHRLLWIHPFADGNGRVARLMSHAALLRLDIGSSLWSVARGLARNVDRYRVLLAEADGERRNDLDGRGPLSLEGLRAFSEFFLDICIDQVKFMQALLQPAELIRRIALYVNDEVAARRLPKGSFEMLREAFYEGEVPRGRAPEITGYEERRARETVSALVEKNLLVSKGPRAPLSLGFPTDVVDRWLPTLYPVDSPAVAQ